MDPSSGVNRLPNVIRPTQKGPEPAYQPARNTQMYNAFHMHTGHGKAPLPAPLNFKGKEFFRPPSGFDTDRTWTPSGVYGKYKWEGPMPEPYPIQRRFSLR